MINKINNNQTYCVVTFSQSTVKKWLVAHVMSLNLMHRKCADYFTNVDLAKKKEIEIEITFDFIWLSNLSNITIQNYKIPIFAFIFFQIMNYACTETGPCVLFSCDGVKYN